MEYGLHEYNWIIVTQAVSWRIRHVIPDSAFEEPPNFYIMLLTVNGVNLVRGFIIIIFITQTEISFSAFDTEWEAHFFPPSSSIFIDVLFLRNCKGLPYTVTGIEVGMLKPLTCVFGNWPLGTNADTACLGDFSNLKSSLSHHFFRVTANVSRINFHCSNSAPWILYVLPDSIPQFYKFIYLVTPKPNNAYFSRSFYLHRHYPQSSM
jgi:hypothetical protein